MIKNKLKLFLPFFICLITLACSNVTQDFGEVSLLLPKFTTDESSQDSHYQQNYTVLIMKNNTVIHKKTYTTNNIIIKGIPIGNYKFSISWEDSKYKYYGEGNIKVVPNISSPVIIKVEKTLKNPENDSVDENTPPTDVKLKSITAVAKNNKYILYNNNLNINDFTITEKYSDNTISELSNNSDYEFTTTGPITTVGTTNVTIRNKYSTSITCSATIPCKYNLPDISLQINASSTPQTIAVPQYTGSEELNAILTPSTPLAAPNDTYTVTYQWQESDNGSSYTNISNAKSQKYSVLVDAIGEKYYKCVATIAPTSSNASFCLDESKNATSSNAIEITVKPWILAVKDITASSGTATLKDGTSYDLLLTNEATTSIPSSITYKSNSEAFVVNGTKVTSSARDTDQVGTISAVIDSGSSKKTLASISVKVPAKIKKDVASFSEFETAINEGAAEIQLTNNIEMTKTLNINKDVIITAKQPSITISRASTFYDTFFSVNANVTFGNNTFPLTFDGIKQGTGAIFSINESKTLTLNSCTLKNNKNASNNGGAIYNAGNCYINKCKFWNNSTSGTSTGNGGVIMNVSGILNITNSILGSTDASTDYNYAENGGAIAVTGGKVTLDSQTIIKNNKAGANGGGIWIDGGTVTSNAQMSGNTAGSGSNVYVTEKGLYNDRKGIIFQ